MLIHLPIVAMAHSRPSLYPTRCQDLTPRKSADSRVDRTVEYDRCSQDEDGARQELQRTWTEFVGSDKYGHANSWLS
jgi:hypothetical protein